MSSEVLVGAISGLATSIAGLGTILWRLQRKNGHEQGKLLQTLEEIRATIQSDLEERREHRRETTRLFETIIERLGYLRRT